MESLVAVGQARSARAGEPVIKVADYRVEHLVTPFAIPDRDVVVRSSRQQIQLRAGGEYWIRGRSKLDDGVEYLVVGESATTIPVLLVRPDGVVRPVVAFYDIVSRGVVSNYQEATLSDPAVRIKRKEVRRIKQGAPYTNFEIVYSGTAAGTLTLAYREFDRFNPFREAKTERLTFDATIKQVAVRGYTLRVDALSPDRLSFTVIEAPGAR